MQNNLSKTYFLIQCGIYIFLLPVLVGCLKEENTMRRRVVKIHYGNGTNYEKYTYLPDGKLAQVITYSRGQVFERQIIHYNLNGQVVKKMNRNEKSGTFSKLDSFFYDKKGRLEMIKGYSILFTPTLSLTYLDSFEYNQEDKIYQKFWHLIFQRKSVGSYHSVYTWAGDNLAHLISYDNDGTISSEYTYTYDDMPNYSYNLPLFYYDNRSLSKNNIIKSVFDGHGKSFSSPCHVCCFEFTYDEYGYPTSRFLQGDGTIFIEYESY